MCNWIIPRSISPRFSVLWQKFIEKHKCQLHKSILLDSDCSASNDDASAQCECLCACKRWFIGNTLILMKKCKMIWNGYFKFAVDGATTRTYTYISHVLFVGFRFQIWCFIGEANIACKSDALCGAPIGTSHLASGRTPASGNSRCVNSYSLHNFSYLFEKWHSVIYIFGVAMHT